MNELDSFLTKLDKTADTFGINKESEVEPPRDPKLEEYLKVFEALAEKYEEKENPLQNYDLTPEEEQNFTSAYHGLNGELAQRSSKYRAAIMSSSLYPPDSKGKVYKVVDDILNQHEFRTNERVRMMEEGEIPNPYKTAREYIEAIIFPQVRDKTVMPWLLRLAMMDIRKFDRIAQENLNPHKQ